MIMLHTVQAFCEKVSHRIWVSFADFKPALVYIEEGLLITILLVFHQQEWELTLEARYGIDGEERMEVDNEPGNCISVNYNLFWFECTGFHSLDFFLAIAG